MLSFWRYVSRDEYADLRKSGQKLNLNAHNLFAAYKRHPEDRLRESHIKLAKIGFVHWVAIPLVFLAVFFLAILVEVLAV